ncbi:MAG TPA: DUF177 domain-containing protein [Nitrolancea sp.]|jgi:uncharacterized protein|nr:DUF177 domain-containing protein [Nitrolancea sp.]
MSLHVRTLTNDTVVNVAQLLKDPVGAARVLDIHLDRFQLDAGLTATDVEANVRLTRVATGILAEGRMSGQVELECVRCLELYVQAFRGEIEGEFRPSIDVRTGVPLDLPEDEDIFVIDNNHELDLNELFRQVAVVSLPMQPLCREDCPGIDLGSEDEGDDSDERLAVLRKLLDNAS